MSLSFLALSVRCVPSYCARCHLRTCRGRSVPWSVYRQTQPDLTDVCVVIVGIYRETVPERRQADVAADSNIVSQAEEGTETGFRLGSEIRALCVNRTYAETTQKEKRS